MDKAVRAGKTGIPLIHSTAIIILQVPKLVWDYLQGEHPYVTLNEEIPRPPQNFIIGNVALSLREAASAAAAFIPAEKANMTTNFITSKQFPRACVGAYK